MKKYFLFGGFILVLLIIFAYIYQAKTADLKAPKTPMSVDETNKGKEVATNTEITNELEDDIEHLVTLAGSRIAFDKIETIKLGENNLSFKLFGLDGHEFKDEDLRLVKEKKMHLMLIREDMQGFQHIHPEYINGKWQVKTAFDLPGNYDMYFDFDAFEEKPTVLRLPFVIDTDQYTKAFPELTTNQQTEVDGYAVSLISNLPIKTKETTKLVYAITKNGQAVNDIKPYLGAMGHVVMFRQTDVDDFFHVHAMENQSAGQGKIEFEAEFPLKGRYTIFAQFNLGDKIITFPITVEVAEDGQASTSKMN